MTERIIPYHSFLGKEGSGKSKQAKLLAQQLSLPYISTGDLMRTLATDDKTYLGDACRKMFNEHVYLSADLLLTILFNRFIENDINHGLVLDGGLRTLKETILTPNMLKKTHKEYSVNVFNLEISEELAKSRLINRGRPDDTPEAIQSRLDSFYLNLNERLSFIKSQPNWRYFVVDGTGTIEEINQKILGFIKE